MSNNEKYNQIIDEVYKRYTDKYVGYEDVPNKELFVHEIKTNPEFSEKWGLKIEGRELSLEERNNYYTSNYLGLDCESHEELNKLGDIPTKLITVTYNNETIEIYE